MLRTPILLTTMLVPFIAIAFAGFRRVGGRREEGLGQGSER